MAALENGHDAVAASSGQSAQFMAISTIVWALFSDAQCAPLTLSFVIIRLITATILFRGQCPLWLPMLS